MSPVHVPAAWVLTGPLPPAVPPPPDDHGVPLKFPFTAPGEPPSAVLAAQFEETELSRAKSFNSQDLPPPSISETPFAASKSTESTSVAPLYIEIFPPEFPMLKSVV